MVRLEEKRERKSFCELFFLAQLLCNSVIVVQRSGECVRYALLGMVVMRNDDDKRRYIRPKKKASRKEKRARIMRIIPNTYFAVSKDGEQQWQTFRYKLLTVIVGTDLKEILKQLVNDSV